MHALAQYTQSFTFYRSVMSYPQVEEEDLINKIRDSEHILTVVGAGLSKPSGIPTFREDRQFWQRSIEELATKSAFERDPGGVWTLYERLRMCAVQSLPNAAHHALACLARAKPRMLIVCQNIEGTGYPNVRAPSLTY